MPDDVQLAQLGQRRRRWRRGAPRGSARRAAGRARPTPAGSPSTGRGGWTRRAAAVGRACTSSSLGPYVQAKKSATRQRKPGITSPPSISSIFPQGDGLDPGPMDRRRSDPRDRRPRPAGCRPRATAGSSPRPRRRGHSARATSTARSGANGMCFSAFVISASRSCSHEGDVGTADRVGIVLDDEARLGGIGLAEVERPPHDSRSAGRSPSRLSPCRPPGRDIVTTSPRISSWRKPGSSGHSRNSSAVSRRVWVDIGMTSTVSGDTRITSRPGPST